MRTGFWDGLQSPQSYQAFERSRTVPGHGQGQCHRRMLRIQATGRSLVTNHLFPPTQAFLLKIIFHFVGLSPFTRGASRGFRGVKTAQRKAPLPGLCPLRSAPPGAELSPASPALPQGALPGDSHPGTLSANTRQGLGTGLRIARPPPRSPSPREPLV